MTSTRTVTVRAGGTGRVDGKPPRSPTTGRGAGVYALASRRNTTARNRSTRSPIPGDIDSRVPATMSVLTCGDSRSQAMICLKSEAAIRGDHSSPLRHSQSHDQCAYPCKGDHDEDPEDDVIDHAIVEHVPS